MIQPIARELAEHGRTPGGRRAILKHIGNALLVQHRVSGLVAVAEKPDVLWERPSLERFYARLEDEYELKERADVLTRKLTVSVHAFSASAKAKIEAKGGTCECITPKTPVASKPEPGKL